MDTWLLWQFDTSSHSIPLFTFVGCRYSTIYRSEKVFSQFDTYSYMYIEISCRVLSVVNPGQRAKLFGATEFLWQQRLVCAFATPSTRHIKSAGLLSQRVGSSTGMKYRFSIGHSLTLGRFRIKLPSPRESVMVYILPIPLNSQRFRDTPAARLLMGIETFRYLSRGARCHSNRDVMAGAKKNSRPIWSLYPSSYSPFHSRAVSTLEKR